MIEGFQERYGSTILMVVVILIGNLVLCGYSLAAPAPVAGGNTTEITTRPAPIEIATPVYPGMGAPIDALKGRHPSVKGNAAIQEYIGECGLGRWDEMKMDTGFLSVHIPPGNSCGKQLVFLTKMAGGHDDPTQIIAVWILDVNETWSGTMDPVYPSVWDYRFQELRAGIRLNPVFVLPCAVIALGLIAILFILVRRQ